MLFNDRKEAGQLLAAPLMKYKKADPIVLAFPRGGVVVGYEVACDLDAPLDVVVARKLGAPDQPELGIGAIAPGGIRVLKEQTVRLLGLSEADIKQIAAEEEIEMNRRLRRYRDGGQMPDLRGRTVILIDDGLATGVTARVAIRSIRQQAPRQLIFASPVYAPDTAQTLSSEVDKVICLQVPTDFGAVGLWYKRFDQTSDEEVIALLKQARERFRGGQPEAA
ncbi:MAG: phosphoribosyltransferase [Candidatus Manganitrophus sp. SA1]|nr:phosphoribosyltransferase [Candidatus Manganitrophus morganii]